MAISKLNISEFVTAAQNSIVLDVRSPGEYMHAHIPGAYSLPLFTDEERKITGTAYKQQSKESAIKLGLSFFGPKMVAMIEEVLQLAAAKTPGGKPSETSVLVHCWRGGMRSAGVAWLLDLYGFTVYTLVGGYKAYRNWVLKQFEKEYALAVMGGYTGSGKTEMLHRLIKQGAAVIDLEALAKHKGSAFGGLKRVAQPSQEMFENLLAQELHSKNTTATIWVEDESQRIGLVNIPVDFFKLMRKQPQYFVNIPFEERLNFIVTEYGRFEKENLVNAIIRIKKRLGGLETKTAINYLLEDNTKECFRVLLMYYDKLYLKALREREQAANTAITIEALTVDAVTNTGALLQLINKI